jgi:long-chain acyl-CoA synthetase
MTSIAVENLPLQRIYHWEKARAHNVYLTQPMGDGIVRDYTWAQTVAEARCVAAYLRAQGYPPKSNIAILSKNCAHWLLSDFAIWMAGHVSVPLYPTLTAESVRQILEHSESKACFVGKLDAWEQMKAGVPSGVHCISYPLSPKNDFPTWDDIVDKGEPIQDSPTRPPEDLATIIYTSGTTGMPKGVMHSFANMAWAAETANERFKGVPGDRALSYLPLSHVAERFGIELLSVLVGNRVFFAESLETFAQDLQRARPTRFISVPRLWIKFQQGVFSKMPREKLDRLFKIPVLNRVVKKKILKGLGLDQCVTALGGAAPMPPAMLNWYKELGLEIMEAYGMTENLAVSHSNLQGQTKPGYVGVPYAGVECRIAPDTGEVQMRSPAVMQGYYKDPDKTRDAMTEDGWLRTGDKGELDTEGRLRITGRVKDLFKTSGGKYVAPAPIEDKLVTHPKVEACCVAGANYPQPFGILMLSLDAQQQAQDEASRGQLFSSLEQHLEKVNAQLDPHEQMKFLTVVGEQWTVDNGFITPTLKVKRNVIEDHYGKHFQDWEAQKKPVVWASA